MVDRTPGDSATATAKILPISDSSQEIYARALGPARYRLGVGTDIFRNNPRCVWPVRVSVAGNMVYVKWPPPTLGAKVVVRQAPSAAKCQSPRRVAMLLLWFRSLDERLWHREKFS
jgi:hypothetical protein